MIIDSNDIAADLPEGNSETLSDKVVADLVSRANAQWLTKFLTLGGVAVFLLSLAALSGGLLPLVLAPAVPLLLSAI